MRHMTPDRLSRGEFNKVAVATLISLFLPDCNRIVQNTPVPEITPTPSGERLARVENSLLSLPNEVVSVGPQAIDMYLSEIVSTRSFDPNLTIPYINNPGMLTDNDEEPSLLTGNKEPGQSQAELALQPLAPEVRLISGGQFVLPLSERGAALLPPIKTVKETNSDGGINIHMVYEQRPILNNRPGLLIPGGKDPDRNVNTPEGNYNRGNILLVLPPLEQGETSLFIQVDTGANWQAQYQPMQMASEKGGLTEDLLSYMLYSPDAQRSEEHGLSALESMYRGTNCQGLGCRTADERKMALAEMAGVGVYVVQLSPKGDTVELLGATVIPDSMLRVIFP